MDGTTPEDPEKSSYEDLELGTLTSYFSFRPPSPRPQQQKNPQNSQKRKEGSAGINRQLTVPRVDTTQRSTKADSTISDSAFLLSPSIIRALEGVHYIADHLRAEDADFSVSISERPHICPHYIWNMRKSAGCVDVKESGTRWLSNDY